jgi:exonuclease SbcC
MRPIRLRMSGFGPFPDSVEVDFDRLGSRGVFLISGETGAGKSTILDGAFGALFGETAGDERKMLDDMPSHHRSADDRRRTELELDFRIGARSYRVARSWREGAAHAAELVELDSEGNALDGTRVTQVRAVAEAVDRLLGLGPDEFRRVCLLPQEKIRNAITASGKERREILLRLFDATRFDHVVSVAARRAKEAKARHLDAVGKVSNLREVLGITDGEDPKAALAAAAEADEEAQGRWDAARGALDRQRDRVRDLEAAARAFGEHRSCRRRLALVEHQLAAHVPRIESCLTLSRRATPVAADVARWIEDDGRLRDLRARASEGGKRAAALALRREAAEARQRRIESIIRTLGRADGLAACTQELRELDRRSERRSRIMAALARLPRAEEDERVAEASVGAAERATREAERTLEVHRLRAPACDLASRLVAGEPCPVCGGTDHPAPAPAPESGRTESLRAALDAARALEQGARRALSDAQAAVQRERSVRDAASEEELADAASPDEAWAGRLRDARADRDRARRAARWRDRLAPARDSARRELAEAEKQEAADSAAAEAAAKTADDLASSLAALRERIDAALASAGLGSDDAARRAALAPERAERLLRRASALRSERGALLSRLASLESPAPPQDPGLLEPERAELMARESDQQRALDARDAARSRHGQLKSGVPRLLAAIADSASAESDVNRLDTLHRTLEGKLPGMEYGLRDYAVRALFDRALDHASSFLDRMGGRYRLSAVQRAGHRGVPEADIQVLDGYTDRPRPPESLSGGEGFQASLALALGLSEAVQESSGGIRLECLFLDEGFGSLDAGALEDAISLLTSIRSGSRLVGAISHVAAMQEQITAQLRVVKSPKGSTVEYRGC